MGVLNAKWNARYEKEKGKMENLLVEMNRAQNHKAGGVREKNELKIKEM